MSPFFSIIIVSLNAENFIGATIESIKEQLFADYEVIVKDGGSKDNTLSFVPVNDSRFCIYQIPDKGIYEAMNQAIEKSTGKYLVFMNCGDYFADKTVLDKVYKLIKDKEYIFIYGDYLRSKILHKQPDVLSPFYMYRTPLCHQTIFFSGAKLKNGEKYNTNYTILADYDLELRLIKQGKIGHIPVVVCEYQGGGVSESKTGVKKKKTERKDIIKNYFLLSQRIKYGIMLCFTMPKLRTHLMYSDKTPQWLKNVYQAIVNRLNR